MKFNNFNAPPIFFHRNKKAEFGSTDSRDELHIAASSAVW
jgi:hypothetical protein